nr:FHA domain-containing protein [Myxococcales bacterium]
MAILEDTATGQGIELLWRHRIGRAPDSDLQLEEPVASNTHAEIQWTGAEGWRVRDLGSRNGTFVGGSRLRAGGSAALREGACLGFGAAEERFRLRAADPPRLVAIPLDGGAPLPLDAGLALPDPAAPHASILRDAAGSFVLEQSGETRPLHDGEVVTIDGARWRLHLPQVVGVTATASSIRSSAFEGAMRFRVSRDEEHVQARLADRDDHEISERGWVHQEELGRMLRMDDNATQRGTAQAGGSRPPARTWWRIPMCPSRIFTCMPATHCSSPTWKTATG